MRRSRYRFGNPAIFAPHSILGAKHEPEQTAVGAKRPATKRRIGERHAGKDAGRTLARRCLLHQRAEGGRQAVAAGDRSEAEPESTRCRLRQVPEVALRGGGQKRPEMPPGATEGIRTRGRPEKRSEAF